MPIHLPPISRRSFLAQTTALSAGLLLGRRAFADEAATDPNFFALLSDTHIPNAPDVTARGVNMTNNLKQVVGELLVLKDKPAAVMINGDCAYLRGLPEDYANLAGLIRPINEVGLPLHLTMGNHDDREPLFSALKVDRPEHPPVESKHVGVIESPHANWFLLDSLTEVNVVTGGLGEAQLAWLSKELDARTNKPAIVMAHHNPQFEPPAEGTPWGGIQDTNSLFELLDSRNHVKAFVYGHSHNWAQFKRGRIHLINLPPVAYVFADGKPNGWVAARLRPNGINLQLHTLDPLHPQNSQTISLNWT